jgi:tetratricopeptide (TPR) repeat protein
MNDIPSSLYYFNKIKVDKTYTSTSAREYENSYMQGTAQGELGSIYSKLKDYDKSINSYKSAIAIYDGILAVGPNADIENNVILEEINLSKVEALAGLAPEARQLSDKVIAAIERRSRSGAEYGLAPRLLAIALTTRGQIEARAPRGGRGCEFDGRALRAWELIERRGQVVPLDLVKGGPVDKLRTDLSKACKAP